MSDNDSPARSRRSIPSKKEDIFSCLKKIKDARDSGTKHREEYKEENIFDIVDEETYAKHKEQRIKENIVDGDSDYFDDGREIFEESEDEVVVTENKKRKKSIKNSNIKRSKSDFKAKPQNVHEMLVKSSVQKPTTKTENFDDLLFEFYESEKKSQNKVKAQPLLRNTPNVFKSAEKPKFKINKSVKNEENIITKNNKGVQSNRKSNNKVDKIVHKEGKIVIENGLDSTKSNISLMKSLNEHTVPNFHFVPEESMDSWNGEMIENQNAEKMQIEHSYFDDINFDDIEFDEPFEENKGFCESEVKVEVPIYDWYQKKEESQTNDHYDSNMIQEFKNNVDCLNTEPNDTSYTKVYWIDAYHDPKIPGAVFLFGKMVIENRNVNCCIKISGLERRLFFLPNKDTDMSHMHKELTHIFNDRNVTSFRCKEVTKKYAFQLSEIPDEADYMMVQYDSKYPSLPADITGDTFSHVFGCETSILELLILDLKLKGPCWLNFKNLTPVTNKFSRCELDFEVNGAKCISKCTENRPNPKLTLLSISVKTVVNCKTSINEIVSVGCFLNNDISFDQAPPNKPYTSHFTVLTAPKDSVLPYDFKKKLSTEWGPRYNDSVEVQPNEHALINNLLAKIHKLDPDLIVGHSLFGHQLQILLQRCQSLNIKTWHSLGRLKRNIVLPRISGKSTAWLERMTTAGRILCDTEFSGRELVKCRSYELSEMIKNILPEKLHGLQNLSTLGDLNQCFLNSTGVKQLIDATMNEAIANIYLMHELQILPLAYQITSICGNLIVRTLSAGKSERNEYLLLHAFNEKNYITPDKYVKSKETKSDNMVLDLAENDTAEESGKRKPKYLGGLVLEPKKGFYEDYILLLDFNSLYPSIIQELNICFTTIDRKEFLDRPITDDTNEDDCPTMNINKLMESASNNSTKPPGILPIEIKKLVEARKQIKGLLLDPKLSHEKKMQYDIRQKALKITANSMYGCLGFSHSRFQATQLASLITCKGREILQKTKDLVESGGITYKINNVPTKFNLEIVYGDTDSIMVNTGLNKVSDYGTVLEMGRKIKEQVNKAYKHIQLDIDGVYRRLLLLKKKKYAALTILAKDDKTGKLITKQELKGLDIVRRDWCKLSIEVGHNIVTKILEGELAQEDLVVAISDYLTEIKEKVNNGSIVLDKFIITKGLARNPETYTNVQGQPHVQVALRHNKSGATRKFRAQDTIEYVICEDGTALNHGQRAYSPNEVLNNTTLKIDTQYYLSHQVHPVISRLVDGIEGLSPATIAESLGLDPKGYVKATVTEDMHTEENHAMNGVDKYRNCDPLTLKCLKCQAMNELRSPINTGAPSRLLWPCVGCKTELISQTYINYLMNTITRAIQSKKKEYYKSVYVCQDLSCGYKCQEIPAVGHVNNRECFTGKGEWLCAHCGQGTMAQVVDHAQLYHQIMFYKFLFTDKKRDESLEIVRIHVDSYLKRSAYCNIGFGKFAALFQ